LRKTAYLNILNKRVSGFLRYSRQQFVLHTGALDSLNTGLLGEERTASLQLCQIKTSHATVHTHSYAHECLYALQPESYNAGKKPTALERELENLSWRKGEMTKT
jgi:hypothetical protein